MFKSQTAMFTVAIKAFVSNVFNWNSTIYDILINIEDFHEQTICAMLAIFIL